MLIPGYRGSYVENAAKKVDQIDAMKTMMYAAKDVCQQHAGVILNFYQQIYPQINDNQM